MKGEIRMKDKGLHSLSYGLYVIGSKLDGKEAGCIVNTVFQVTNENPLICISMSKENATLEAIRQTGRFSVSILSEETDPSIIGTFGFKSSRQLNKFEGIRWKELKGVPLVMENIPGYLICEPVKETDAETHVLILARVICAEDESPFRPMTYSYYHEVIKGKAPKTAPTYSSNETVGSEKGSKSYICDICGYIYEGDITQEPDSYLCPICGVDKSHFKPQP